MSRSGYSDIEDNWAIIKYRGQVASAMRGKRGQAFLRDLAKAMDAMPKKALIAHELQNDGCVCAIGSVGQARGVDMSKLDPDDIETVAAKFDVAPQLAREVVYENDEGGGYVRETPEKRWSRMRDWVRRQIKQPPQEAQHNG